MQPLKPEKATLTPYENISIPLISSHVINITSIYCPLCCLLNCNIVLFFYSTPTFHPQSNWHIIPSNSIFILIKKVATGKTRSPGKTFTQKKFLFVRSSSQRYPQTLRRKRLARSAGHLGVPVNVCSGLCLKQGAAEKEHASQCGTLSLDKSKVKIKIHPQAALLLHLPSFLTRPPHRACALPHQRRICLKPQRSHNRQKRSSPGSRCRCLWFWREEKRGEKVTQPHGSFLLSADFGINGGIKHRGR